MFPPSCFPNLFWNKNHPNHTLYPVRTAEPHKEAAMLHNTFYFMVRDHEAKTPAPVRHRLNGRAPRWNWTSCSTDTLPVRETKTHTILHARLCNTCVVKVTPFCLQQQLESWLGHLINFAVPEYKGGFQDILNS